MIVMDRHKRRRAGQHAYSDAELVAGTLAGDRSSFDSLVERYRDQVFRLAYVKVRNAQEAEDLAQDAFVAAYRSLGQLRQRDHFAAWLRRVAENVCNMRLRRSQPSVVQLADDLIPGEDPRQSLESRLVAAEIVRALDELSETNRLAAILFFVDGLSQREIAEFLDLPLTTIKRRVNLARTQIRREMLDLMKESIGQEKPDPDFGQKVSLKIDVTRWYRRFSEYIDVGQNLVSTLARLAEGDYHETIRAETRAIMAAVQGGKTLTDAMGESAPTLGTTMAIGMVRAGEIAGVLQHSAHVVVSWLEMEEARVRVDAAYWLRTLAFVLRAGVGLLTAVETMRSVPASEPLASLPDRLVEEIHNGGFAGGFVGHPVFSESTIALIRAGEKSGTLEAAMELAATETMRGAYEQAMPSALPAAEATPELLRALRSQVSDTSPDMRLGALRAFEHVAGLPLSTPKPQTRRIGADQAGDALLAEENLACFISALGDRDARVRELAAQVLQRHPSDSAVVALTAAVDDASARVREQALLALHASDAGAAMEKAKSKISDESPDVRRAAVRVVADRRDSESIPLLIRALDDPELLVASPAAQALVGVGQAALDPLVNSVRSRLPHIPDMGWNVLCEIDPVVAREVALGALAGPVTDEFVRVRLVSKLAAVATVDDAPILLQALAEFPHGHQWGVIRAVGRLKLREAVPGLVSWLDYPEPSLWWWVADVLAKIGDPSGAAGIAARLGSLVKDDERPASEVEAAAVASKFVAALAELSAKQYAGLVMMAVTTFRTGSEHLARIAGPPEAKRMAKLLSDNDDDLAVLATRFFLALVDRGDESRTLARDAGAIAALGRAAKSDNPGIRSMAAIAHRKLKATGSDAGDQTR